MSEPHDRTIPSILTLGALSVREGAASVAHELAGRRKPFCLLVYLGLGRGPGAWHERSSLCAMFWAESDEGHARASLRQAIRTIERSVGPVIERRGADEIRLKAGAVRIDAVDFQDALATADWLGAARRYHGPFLDGVHLRGAPGFMRWADLTQLRLADGYRTALAGLSNDGDAAPEGPIWAELGRRAPHDGAAAHTLAEALSRSLSTRSRASGPTGEPDVETGEPSPLVAMAPHPPRQSPRRLLLAAIAICAVSVPFLARRSEPPSAGSLQIAVPSFRASDDTNPALGQAFSLIVAEELGRLDSVVVVPFHLMSAHPAEDRAPLAGRTDLLGPGVDLLARGALLGEVDGETSMVLDLIDVRAGSRLGTSVTVRGASSDMANLASQLGRRAATRIVDTYRRPDALRGDHARQSRPPVLGAYLAFADALTAFAAGDVPSAARYAALALDRDPEFVGARIELAIQRLNQRDVDGAQRLIDEIDPTSRAMTPWDRDRLDWTRAVLRGDREARVHIANRHRTPGTRYQRAWELSEVGRLTESLAVLDDSTVTRLPEFLARERWLRTVNLHRLGRHDEELAESRRHSSERPTDDQPFRLQVRALVGRGDVAGVERLFDQAHRSSIPHLPALIAHEAGIEFLAHGRETEGHRWIGRAIDAYPAVTGPGSRFEGLRAEALSAAGRWAQAEAALQVMLARSPESPELRTRLAVVQARTGRSDVALAVVTALDGAPASIAGDRAIMQARIFAALGDADEVERRLEAAIRLGAARPGWTHTLTEWRFLRDRSVLARWLDVS